MREIRARDYTRVLLWEAAIAAQNDMTTSDDEFTIEGSGDVLYVYGAARCTIEEITHIEGVMQVDEAVDHWIVYLSDATYSMEVEDAIRRLER